MLNDSPIKSSHLNRLYGVGYGLLKKLGYRLPDTHEQTNQVSFQLRKIFLEVMQRVISELKTSSNALSLQISVHRREVHVILASPEDLVNQIYHDILLFPKATLAEYITLRDSYGLTPYWLDVYCERIVESVVLEDLLSNIRTESPSLFVRSFADVRAALIFREEALLWRVFRTVSHSKKGSVFQLFESVCIMAKFTEFTRLVDVILKEQANLFRQMLTISAPAALFEIVAKGFKYLGRGRMHYLVSRRDLVQRLASFDDPLIVNRFKPLLSRADLRYFILLKLLRLRHSDPSEQMHWAAFHNGPIPTSAFSFITRIPRFSNSESFVVQVDESIPFIYSSPIFDKLISEMNQNQRPKAKHRTNPILLNIVSEMCPGINVHLTDIRVKGYQAYRAGPYTFYMDHDKFFFMSSKTWVETSLDKLIQLLAAT